MNVAKAEGTYHYFRIGSLEGRAGQASHIAIEVTKEGGRIILGDGYMQIVHCAHLSNSDMRDFLKWVKKRLEEVEGDYG